MNSLVSPDVLLILNWNNNLSFPELSSIESTESVEFVENYF